MFTDGIERLVLDLQEKTPHAPFFRTLFGWLVKTEPAAVDEEIPISEVVSRYLRSKQINDKTDDDKTLRFFADGAAKKWPLRGSLKRASAFL